MTARKKIFNKNEIDIVQLIKVFWEHKVSIIIIVFISMISGILMNYSNLNKKEFRITANYSIIHYSPRVKNLCGSDINCLNTHTSDEIVRMLGYNWSYNLTNKEISLSTITPLESKEYLKKLEKISYLISDDILLSAYEDISEYGKIIDAKKNVDVAIVENLIEAKRLYNALKSGEKSIYFGNIKIEKIPLKIYPILISFAIIGIAISLAYVTISYNTIKKTPTK